LATTNVAGGQENDADASEGPPDGRSVAPQGSAVIATTKRRKALAESLTLLLPGAPYADIEAIRTEASSRHMRELPPSIAVWLATVAHVRHQHTDYDDLLAEGYDRDAARFFVVDRTNAVLTSWRATRLLDPEDGE